MMRIKFVSFVFCALIALSYGEFNEGTFKNITRKLEGDVKELANQVKELYKQRCTSLAQCERKNYDHCLSTLPTTTCPRGENYYISECGEGLECNGKFNFDVSSVRILKTMANGPEDNPKDPELIESICYTQQLDSWFKAKRDSDASYWNQSKVEPMSMYFGSVTGAFRIYPARHSKDCFYYDPRLRPWYIAASSGPKDVIMILDTSGSMKGERIEQLRWAAERVVDTLSASDSIAIVLFADEARAIDVGTNSSTAASTTLIPGNATNKEALKKLIKGLEVNGATNFHNAFNLAFDILNASISNESDNDCNTAILFLTDGEMSFPKIGYEAETEVIELVKNRSSMLSDKANIVIFTYSVAGAEDNVDKFPQRLACEVDRGIWKQISKGEDIADVLWTYYLLFAWGLGNGTDYVAWVEPYNFTTGNTRGITVSTPVYDDDVYPPVFLGVAAIDLAWAALIVNASGGKEDDEMVYDAQMKLVESAKCVPLELNDCEMEAFRRQSGNSTCDSTCQFNVSSTLCSDASLPVYLWNNVNSTNLDYIERTCCSDADQSSQCMADITTENNTEIVLNSRSQPLFQGTANPAPAPPPPSDKVCRNCATIFGSIAGAITAIVGLIFIYDYLFSGCCPRTRGPEPDEFVDLHNDLDGPPP